MWHLTVIEWAVQAVRVCAAVVVGGNVGSFLNVVAWRIPRGESVIFGRSHCPACGSLVRARDNVPVIGWLRLRGRCRDCGGSISARYPSVEAACAAIGLVLALADGSSTPAIVSHGLLFAMLVVLALFERDGFETPSECVATILLFATSMAATFPDSGPLRPDWPWVAGAGSFANAGTTSPLWRGLPARFASSATAIAGAFAGWIVAGVCLPRLPPHTAGDSDHGMPSGGGSQPAWSLVLIGAFCGWQAVVATMAVGWPLHAVRSRITAARGATFSRGWCVDLCTAALAILAAWRAAGG